MKGLVICFFIILFVCFYVKGQQKSPVNIYVQMKTAPAAMLITPKRIFNFSPQTFLPAENIPVKTIPAGYYTSCLGFFCRKELQLQKAINFPVKIRLGSVSYIDRMEGKKNAAAASVY